MNLFYKLALLMGAVVVLSNYLVQFPINYIGLSEILTYGAFSYPITFLITDLANRSIWSTSSEKNCLHRIFYWSSFNLNNFDKFFGFNFY